MFYWNPRLLGLLFANWIISISAFFLAFGVAVKSGVPSPINIACISGGGTLVIYNLQRLFKLKKMDAASIHLSAQLTWINSNRLFIGLSVFFGALMAAWGFLFVDKSLELGFVLLSSAVLCLWYVVPLGGVALREIPRIKILGVALTWALVVVGISATQPNNWSMNEWLMAFVAHSMLIVATTIPFDIRDLPFDSNKLKTIPQEIGIFGAKVISLVLMVCYAALAQPFFANLTIYFVLLAVTGCTMLAIWKASPRRDAGYYLLVIDGLLALLGLVWMI